MRLKHVYVRFLLCTFLALLTATAIAKGKPDSDTVERWGIFELALKGPSGGNPFVDVQLSGEFRQNGRVFTPEGFYDGNGVYRIRFMPDTPGVWSYVTVSNRSELSGREGKFTCVKPSPGNHGPVRVHKTWHFAYADGTAYFQVGTTCYAWVHQGNAMEEQTLTTLKDAPFNKMRMCVFPKSYSYNKNEPEFYPFEGKPLKGICAIWGSKPTSFFFTPTTAGATRIWMPRPTMRICVTSLRAWQLIATCGGPSPMSMI
jgi:hypothetical protein